MEYQTLINQGRYEEAANKLRKQLEFDPDDEKRSLLAVCLWIIGQTENALQVVAQIEHPTPRDYLLLANIHWELRNWDEMVIVLKSALRVAPSAEIYHRLAIAEGRGRYLYQIDAASKEIMRGYLSKATDFEDCSVKAYLFLVALYEPEESDSKLNTLLKALERYPNDADVRLELASVLIYEKKQYEQAIELITPLFDTYERSGEARWYAFEASVRKKKYLEATQYLEGIPVEGEKQLARIKADLLFKQGRLGEWLISSDEYADDNSPEPAVRKYFCKAYVNLHKNNIQQAIDDFTKGAKFLLETNTISDVVIDIQINNRTFWYAEFDVIMDVCETLLLLDSDTNLLTNQSLGLLAYTIYSCCSEEKQQELSTFFPEHSDSLLLLAAKLLNFPPSLGKHLAWEFLNKELPTAVHYYLAHSIWAHNSDSYFVQNISNQLYRQKKHLDETALQQIPPINEVVINYLRACKDSEVLIEVFLPFYDHFWRSVLFDTQAFKIVASVSKQFVDASDGTEGLFDYAYSLDALGKQDESQAAYLSLISQEPNNASALNNLGVIYERNAMLDEAFEFYSQAYNLFPSKQLYAGNRNRLKKSLDSRKQSLQKLQEALEAIKHKAYDIGLNDEQLAQLNSLYWESETTIKQIQEQLNLRQYGSSNIYNFVIPKYTGEKCPNCLIELVYKSRSARNSEDKVCLSCGHQSRGWCRCAYCIKLEEQRRQQAEKARRQAAIEEFRKLQEQYYKQDYVEWAVTKLSRREKIFLKSFIEVIQKSDKPTWEEIREIAGVVSEKTYVEKLKKLKLLLVHPNESLVINSAIQVSMLEVKTVRRITPSLRFDVFQRDNHTCQYCGRTPPDVKLVIDHLIPVAQGGTDDFENLVTSCEECNSGKSDKLLKEFTGGYSKEEWSEQIRVKRVFILRERRERLDEIRQHWMESLGRRSLSERDNITIYNFVERYEPDWIKAAIGIAARKGVQHYINYTGAILGNWAKEGPPEYLSNPDAGLAKKPATPKQITYIASLLERAGLSLNAVCDKTDFDQLTMLDARNLISALTEEVDE